MWEAILGHIPAQARVARSDAMGLGIGSVVRYVHFWEARAMSETERCARSETPMKTLLAGALFLS